MKTTVLTEKCIACGKCYSILPEVFDLDDDGIAFNQLGDATYISDDLHSRLQSATANCPTRAIVTTKE